MHYTSIIVFSGGTYDEDKIVCHLFTLGEVVQLCPGRLPKRVFLLVQSMIATPCITSLPASQAHTESQNTDDQQSEPDSQPGNPTRPSSQSDGASQPSSQQENNTSQRSDHSSPDSSRGNIN